MALNRFQARWLKKLVDDIVADKIDKIPIPKKPRYTTNEKIEVMQPGNFSLKQLLTGDMYADPVVVLPTHPDMPAFLKKRKKYDHQVSTIQAEGNELVNSLVFSQENRDVMEAVTMFRGKPVQEPPQPAKLEVSKDAPFLTALEFCTKQGVAGSVQFTTFFGNHVAQTCYELKIERGPVRIENGISKDSYPLRVLQVCYLYAHSLFYKPNSERYPRHFITDFCAMNALPVTSSFMTLFETIVRKVCVRSQARVGIEYHNTGLATDMYPETVLYACVDEAKKQYDLLATTLKKGGLKQ